MRIALLGVCLMLVCPAVASAQSVSGGVKAGINFANLDLNGDVGVNFDSRTGLVAGGFVTIPVSSKFDIQPEALFAVKGASAEQSGIKETVRVNFLEFPVLARVTVGRSGTTSAHLFAGPSFGFRLSAKTVTEFQGTESTEDIKDDVAGFDVGAAFGGDIEIAHVVFDARYTFGFRDLSRGAFQDVTAKNRVFSLLAGIRF